MSQTWRAADELSSVESVDGARLEHGEAMQRGSVARVTCLGRAQVPRVVRLTLARVVDVVELTVLRHTQSLALERTHCTPHARRTGHCCDMCLFTTKEEKTLKKT